MKITIVNTEELLEALRISRPTLNRWRRKHPDFPRVKGIYQGRYVLENVLDWMKGKFNETTK